MNNNYTLITGASAGIGKQLSLECAKRGLNVFLVSLPDTGLESLANEISEEYPVDVKFLDIDLTGKDAPQRVFDFAQENNITVDILANNVGVGYRGKFEEQSPEHIDDMIQLNIRTSTMLTYLFLPLMKELKRAYILNISSFGGLIPLPYKCVYAATKTYLLFLTQALNCELRDSNVSVLSVHPSGVRSERALGNIGKSYLMAKLSSLTPGVVAKVSLDKMIKGKKFVVPGMVSRIYYFIGSMLPYWLVLRIVGLVFRRSLPEKSISWTES